MNNTSLFLQTHDYACWCGQQAGRIYCRQSFGRRPFLVFRCGACGTHRVLPRVLADQTAADALYNQYAAPSDPGDLTKFAEHQLQRMAATGVEFLPGQTVLEVGCGTGVNVEAICARFQCSGMGIDVDRRRIELARSRAKRVEFESGLFEADKVSRRFDHVISSAVIEHVIDPIEFLRQHSAVLVPGGSLWVLTPNASSLSYRFLRSWWRELLSLGEHIYLFTPDSLVACARRAGLEPVKLASDFDFVRIKVNFGGAKAGLVTLWSAYRELVKRVSARAANGRQGDILFAHFRKPK